MCVCMCVRQGQAVRSVFVLLAVGRAQLTVCVSVRTSACVWVMHVCVYERERRRERQAAEESHRKCISVRVWLDLFFEHGNANTSR